MSDGLVQQYGQVTLGILGRILETQSERILAVGRLGAEAIRGGGLIHVFGTGHSHLVAEEVLDRAGGLVTVNAVLVPSLMLHEGVQRSSALERLPGMAEQLLKLEPLRGGDLMIIVSNSGRNAVPVEAAIYAKAHGLKVAAITSLAHSESQPPVHASGKRLFELADIVLDNGGVPGDGVLAVPGVPVQVCATSTVAGAFIIQAVMAAVVEQLQDLGPDLPVLQSGNIDGSKAYTERIFALYADRIRRIRAYLG